MSSIREHENQEIERSILEEEYKAWDEILKTRERQPYGIFDKLIRFAIDRRNDAQSSVTVDECWAISLRADQTLEGYLAIEDPSVLKSEEKERWILIYVAPENPYNPRVRKLTAYDNKFYLINALGIYISSLGRAFEQSWQSIIWPPKNYRTLERLLFLKTNIVQGRILTSPFN